MGGPRGCYRGIHSVTFQHLHSLVPSCSRESTREQQSNEILRQENYLKQHPKMVSRIRQNFKEESEALINKQINMEFYAIYVYMSMYAYFDRDDQAMPGFAAFFKKSSEEERAHGEKLIKYQNKRGGKVVFQDVAKPSSMEWGTPLEALEAALELEKTVNQSLLDLHKASDGDAHLCDFLEAEFLDEQVEGIKEISTWITKMKRAGPGLGYHMIDKEIGS